MTTGHVLGPQERFEHELSVARLKHDQAVWQIQRETEMAVALAATGLAAKEPPKPPDKHKEVPVPHLYADLMEDIEKSPTEAALRFNNSQHADKVLLVFQLKKDNTHATWRRRSFLVPSVFKRWLQLEQAASSSDARQSDTATRHAPHTLKSLRAIKIPASLRTKTDANELGEAWNQFRPTLLGALHECFQHGCQFMEVIRALNILASHPTEGSSRIKGLTKNLMLDDQMMACPPVAADVLMLCLDTTYVCDKWGEEAALGDWTATSFRADGEDLDSLATRVINAYVAYANVPTISKEDLWKTTLHANQITTRYQECLANYPNNPELGGHLSAHFRGHLLTAQRQLQTDPRLTSLHVSLNRITSDHLLGLETAWNLLHLDAALLKTPREDKRNNRKGGAAVVNTPPPAATRSIVAAGIQAMGHSLPVSSGTSPIMPFQTPRAAAVAAAGQTPFVQRRETHPTGSTGEPKGVDWNVNSWLNTEVSLSRITDLAGTPAGKVTAKARPSDKSMTKTETAEMNTLAIDRTDPMRPIYPVDACRYCYYRPIATATTPAADQWWYGIGNGAHNPLRCQAIKRFLAEGGLLNGQPAAQTAEITNAIRSCLIESAYRPYGKGKGYGRGSGNHGGRGSGP